MTTAPAPLPLAPSYTHAARGVGVTDGDTLDVELDLGRYGTTRVTVEARLRLLGVDTPERGHPDYQRARLHVIACTFARRLVVTTTKPDKYGRQLATVQLEDGRDLATTLLDAGLAKPYAGGTR